MRAKVELLARRRSIKSGEGLLAGQWSRSAVSVPSDTKRGPRSGDRRPPRGEPARIARPSHGEARCARGGAGKLPGPARPRLFGSRRSATRSDWPARWASSASRSSALVAAWAQAGAIARESADSACVSPCCSCNHARSANRSPTSSCPGPSCRAASSASSGRPEPRRQLDPGPQHRRISTSRPAAR